MRSKRWTPSEPQRQGQFNRRLATDGGFCAATKSRRQARRVNSVLPGPVITGRRRSYLAHWAPLHNMTVQEATTKFPREAGIAHYGEPEEIAELMAFFGIAGRPLDDGLDAAGGWRRGQIGLRLGIPVSIIKVRTCSVSFAPTAVIQRKSLTAALGHADRLSRQGKTGIGGALASLAIVSSAARGR